jgi:hypothetical protein
MARGEIDRFDVLFENLIKRGQILGEMLWRNKPERVGFGSVCRQLTGCPSDEIQGIDLKSFGSPGKIRTCNPSVNSCGVHLSHCMQWFAIVLNFRASRSDLHLSPTTTDCDGS